MTSEAENPEAIFTMKTEQEGCLSKQSSRTVDEFSPMGLEKFKGGSNQPLETVEHATGIESSRAHCDEAETVISVIKGNIETPEGESFLESTSATNVASEETRRAPEHYQALGVPHLVDHYTSKDDKIVETVEEKVYKGKQDMDEAVEKMEMEKGNIDHYTLDVKESQTLKVVGEEISGMSIETTKDDGKEALLHASDLTVENLNEEAEMVTEMSSDPVSEEKDPEANTPRENEKHEKESATCDIIEDKSISTIAASSSIQNSNDAISEIGENGKDKLDGPSVSLATGRVSDQETGLKEGQLIGEATIFLCDKESQDTGVTSEQMKELAEVHRQMQPDDDVGVSSVTETEEMQIEENPEILSQVSQTQPEDMKQSPKEEQNEAFARESGTDDEKPEAKLVSSFLKCEEVKQDNERDQSLSENVDSFTLNKEENTIKTFEKSMEEDYKEDKPTHINDITEKETSIEKIDADEENATAEVELSNRNVGDIHVPHPLVDETTQVQGENPENVSKLVPEEQVTELITSKEDDRHIVNELEAYQSTENTKTEQTSTEGAITMELNTRKRESMETLDCKGNSGDKGAEKNTEETKEEAKVDSLFSPHDEDMQNKDKDLPMENVSEITNGMNIDSSEIIEFAEHDNMENLKHDFGQQNEQVVEKQQIPSDLVAEENETSSRESVNIIEEELNKSLRHRLEGKDEEDKPTDTNEMEKIDADEKNQTAEVEYSNKNVGDINVPHSLVDESIQAESENLDTISNSEPGEQVHEGKGTHVEEDKHIGDKLEVNQSRENKEPEQTSAEEITMELNTRKCENMETLDSLVNLDVKDAAKNIEDAKEDAKPDSSFMLSEEGMHSQDKDLPMEDVPEIITQKNVDNSKTIEVAEHDTIEDFVQQNEPVKEKLEKSLDMESDQENKITALYENIDSCTFTEEERSIETLEVSMEATDEPTDTNSITEKEISIEQTDAHEENQTTDVEFSNKSLSEVHVPHSFADETPQVEGENHENVSKLEPEEQVHELNRASKEEDMHIGNRLEANQRAEDTNLEQTFTEGTTAMQLNTVTFENTETLSSKGSLDVTDAEKNIKETKEEDCSTERTKINTKGDEDEYSPALPLRAECIVDEKAELNSPAEVEETERESIGEGKSSKREKDVENNNKDAQVHPEITDRREFTKEQIIEGDVACLSPEPIEEGRMKHQGNENEKEEDANEQTITESLVKDRSLDLVQDGQFNDFQDNKKESGKALEEEQETMVEVEAIQNEASQNNKNLEGTSDTTLMKQEESLQAESVNLAQMQATIKDESNGEKYPVTSLEKQEESKLAAKVNVDPMETEIETQIDEGKSNITVEGEDNNHGLAEATETVKTGGPKDNMEEVNAAHEELITDGNDEDISRNVILEDSFYLKDDEMGTEKNKEEEPETGAGESISCFTSQDNQSPGRSHALVKQEESSQVHDVNMNPTEAITENKSQEEKIPVEYRDNDVPEVKETMNTENETEKEGNYEVRSTDFVGEPLVDVPHTEKEPEKSKQETFQESESEIVDATITDKPNQDDQGPERIFDTTLVEAEESLRVADMHMTPTEDKRDEKYYVVTGEKHEDVLVDAKEESEKNIPRMVEYMEQNVQEDDRVEKLEGLSNVTSEEIKENTSSKSEEKIPSKEETIQNPVEASEETKEWEETKNLEEPTENKTAKEEDIKTVPEELKDSKSTEGKSSELDSPNVLETTNAGNETREQDHDGIKVRSPESTETETTPDNSKEDENLQSTKLDEKLECTSELVAEDESNVIPETNLGPSDENINTAQDHTWKFFEEQIIRQQFTNDERETDEDIEPKSENRDHFDNIENQKEDTHATVSIDEIQNGEEKDDESENFKETVSDEENKKEGHVVFLDVETVDKVEASSPVSTQYLKRQDSEQKEAENSEKEIVTLEDPETKEVNTNQGVPDACSKHEVQGVRESLEREPEEKLNVDADEVETIVARQILEPRLEDSQLDDEPAEAFINTPDEKALETTEPGLHGNEVDSVELEETIPDLASQLSAFDHDEAKKECIIIEDSEANEADKSQEDSDTHTKSEDNILKETDADETGTNAKTEIPEKILGEVKVGGEPIEVFVSTSDVKDLETSETSLHGEEVDSMKVGKISTDLPSQLTNSDAEKEEKKSITMEDPETSEEIYVKETDDKLTVEKLDVIEADATGKTETPEMRFRELQLDDKPQEDFLVTSDERPLVTTEASQHGDEADSMKLEEASSHGMSQLSICDHYKTEEESITVEDPEPNEVTRSQAFSDIALMPEDCDVRQAEETEAEKNQTAEKLDADEGDKTVRTVAPIEDEKCDNALVEAKEESGENIAIIVESTERNLQEDDRAEMLQGLSRITSEEAEENASHKTVEKITSTEEEIIQNPVEASRETTKWEQTNILDDFTQNESAKEEDIKTVPEVLKDSKILEMDSPNMLETANAGEETSEQKVLDGVKVCSPDSTETETTPDDCEEDKNLQSTKLVEKLECTSKLVAEDESNEIPETYHGQSDENINTPQDYTWKFVEEQIIRQQYTEGERVTEEDIEPKSENQDHIDNIENQKEDTHAIVSNDEVQNWEEKDGERENLKENVTEEENKKEGRVVSLDVETLDKVEVSSPLSTQYLQRQDSEQKEAENSEKEIATLEDPETKEVDTNQEVPDECSKHEVLGVRESLEREPEEKLNVDAVKVETIVAREILEPRLEDSQLDDEPAEAFTNTPVEKVLKTTEPGLHGDEVDSVELEETIPDLVQLSVLDHDEAKKECIIIEDSEANEADKSQEDSDTHTKSEDNILLEIDADETGTNAKTEIPDGDEADSMKLQEASSHVVPQLSTCDHDKTEEESITVEDPEPNEVNGRQAFSDAALVPEDCDAKQAEETEAEKNQTAEKLDADEGDKTVRTGAIETSTGEEQPSEKPTDDLITTSNERSLETIEVNEAHVNSDEVDSMHPKETSFDSVSEPPVIYNENVKQGIMNVDKDLETSETSLPSTDLESPTKFDTEKEDKRGVTMEDPETSEESHVKETDDELTVEKLEAVEADATVITETPEMRFRESQLDDKPIENFHATSDERPLIITETTGSSRTDGDEVDSMNLGETSSHAVSQLSARDHDKTEEESIPVEDPEPNEVYGSQAFSDAALMPEDCDVKQTGETEAEKNQTAGKLDADEGDKTVVTGATEMSVGEEQPNDKPADDLVTISNERSLETIEITEAPVHSDEVDSMNPEETSFDSMPQPLVLDKENVRQGSLSVDKDLETSVTNLYADEVDNMKVGKPRTDLESQPANFDSEKEDKRSVTMEDPETSEESYIKEADDQLAAEKHDAVEADATVKTETSEAMFRKSQLDNKPIEDFHDASDERPLTITETTESSPDGDEADSMKLEEASTHVVSQLSTCDHDKTEEESITVEDPEPNEVNGSQAFSDAALVNEDCDAKQAGETEAEKNQTAEKLEADEGDKTVRTGATETSVGEEQPNDKPADDLITASNERSLETIEIIEARIHSDKVDSMNPEETSFNSVSEPPVIYNENVKQCILNVDKDLETSEESHVKETDDELTVEKLEAVEADAAVKTETPEMRFRKSQLDDKPIEDFHDTSDERPLIIAETTEPSPDGDEVDGMKLEETSSHAVSQLSTCDHDKTEEESINVEDPEPNEVNGSQAFSETEAGETEAEKNQTAENLDADEGDKTVRTGATEMSVGEEQPNDKPADDLITTSNERSLEKIEIIEACVHSDEVDSMNPEETSFDSVSQTPVIDNENVKQGSLNVEIIDGGKVEESKTSSGIAFESNYQSDEGKNESGESLAAEKVYVHESSEGGSALAAETTSREAQSNEEPLKALGIVSNERSLETIVTTEARLPGNGESLELEETASTFVSQFPTTDGDKAERVTAEVPGANAEVQETHTFSDVVSVSKDEATTEETSIMGAQLDDKPVKIFTSNPKKSSPEATEISEASLQGKRTDSIEVEESTSDWVFIHQNTDLGDKEKGSVAVDEDRVEESKLSSDAVFESNNQGDQIDEYGKGLPAENQDVDQTSETVTDTEASLEDAQLDDKIQKPHTTANDESSLGINDTAEASSLQGEGGDIIKLEETTSNLVSQLPSYGSENAEKENITEGVCDADKVEETKISSDAVNELKDHDGEETGKSLIMEKLNPDATSVTATDITKETGLEEAGQNLLDNKHVNAIISSPDEKSSETIEAIQKEVETLQLQDDFSNLSTNAEEDNLGSDAVLESEVGLKGIEGTGKILAVDKIDNETAAGQIPTSKELEERLEISTSAFPIDEQEHKGTITVKKLEEENKKEVETLEDHSTTIAPEESCLQMEEDEKLKAAPQEIKLNKDLQRNSPSVVCEGEGQPRDGAFQLERQKDEDEVKYVSSPSECEQIVKLTRPCKEASISKSEASEESFESVMICEVTKTGLTEEDHKTSKGIPTTNNEVLSEKVSDKEVVKGQQEPSAEEVTGNKMDKVPQTITNDTQNEELTEESNSHHTHENIEKGMENVNKIVVDSGMISMKEETEKERFPDEPERMDGVGGEIRSNLEDQNGQTNSGNSKEEAALICQESGTEMPQGTMVDREANKIPENIDQKEQSSLLRAQRQIPEETLDETTEAKISSMKEDVPPKRNAATPEFGNVTDVNSEVAGIEHGGQEMIDLSEKATEGSILIDRNKISLSDLLHKSKKESSQVAEHSTEQEESTASQEEMKSQVTETIPVEGPKSDEEDGEEHEKIDHDSAAPVIIEASRDIDVKAAHKKSHGILSGVGSKVKHSISKVKKVITGKSSHPKTLSPK